MYRIFSVNSNSKLNDPSNLLVTKFEGTKPILRQQMIYMYISRVECSHYVHEMAWQCLTAGCDVVDEIHNTAAVAKFIVVP